MTVLGWISSVESAFRALIRGFLHGHRWPANHAAVLITRGLRSAPDPSGPEILYLPALPLEYRWQRPQQLALALATSGARVTYVDIFRRNLVQPLVTPRDFGGSFRWLRIALGGRPNPFMTGLDDRAVDRIRNVLVEVETRQPDWLLVQHPLWFPFVQSFIATSARVVYDRIDLHSGFVNVSKQVSEDWEEGLIDVARVVSYTSELLKPASRRGRQQSRLLLPNAVDDTAFFPSDPPAADTVVIGYVGALDNWFDVEVATSVARSFPDGEVRIAGMPETPAIARALTTCPNIRLAGEISYDRVPGFLGGIHVLLIPFKDLPISRCVDPVKLYEALAVGRPVVAPRHLSLQSLGAPHVYTYDDPDDAVRQIENAVAVDCPAAIQARVRWAREHTWSTRAQALLSLLAELRSCR